MKEKDNDIVGSITLYIHGEKIDYILDALLELDDNSKCMCSLSFYNDYGHNSEKLIVVWDSESFLIETLYNQVLTPWIVDKSIPNALEFAELLKVKGVVLEDFQGIHNLITKGIELGLFQEYFTKKEKENEYTGTIKN